MTYFHSGKNATCASGSGKNTANPEPADGRTIRSLLPLEDRRALPHDPDFPRLLSVGTDGIIDEIRRELDGSNPSERKAKYAERDAPHPRSVNAYTENLAGLVAREAEIETVPERKKEIEQIAEMTAHSPKLPARTIHEAVNALWIAWVALHAENTNAGLSIGRSTSGSSRSSNPTSKKFLTPRKENMSVAPIELIGWFLHAMHRPPSRSY